ncbi:hypothetical protein MKX01_025068 [Papaver californicum]|nr:hypothetical protein MKX01_025068 [Papaver californicum]
MALHLQLLTPSSTISSPIGKHNLARRVLNINSHVANLRFKCFSIPVNYEPTVPRRSEHYQYQPTIWDYDFVESLQSSYVVETYMDKMEKRKKDVRLMLEKAETPLAKLELIDVIQRLGMGYLFEEEIKGNIYDERHIDTWKKDNLHATALSFRLLRQYGFQVFQDVFYDYKHARGDFQESVAEDVKGMLGLYEAAHIVSKGEQALEDAIFFTTKYLKLAISSGNIHPNLANQITEAKWFIDAYEKEKDVNPLLFELAKLNFNMVQATHQADLRNMSMWWRSLGVATKLNFARERLVESFLWSMGIALYTIQRMKWALETLKDQGWDILPYLTKSWANFIKAMLVEAKWCNEGYTPSLKGYLENGWLSSSGSVFLVHAFFATVRTPYYSLFSPTKHNIKTDGLKSLEDNHDLLYCASMMFRLSNDLATSSAELERGDVASSIHCYMREKNASEMDAREHVRGLIKDTWKKMNGSICDSPFDLSFINMALNLVRTSLFIYQYGDGLGVEDTKSKGYVMSLIVNPVQMETHKVTLVNQCSAV